MRIVPGMASRLTMPEAVAAGDDVAGDVITLPALGIVQARRLAGQAVQADVLRLVDDRPAGCFVGVHQVSLDLGLAVDGDGLAGQRLEVDAPTLAVERQLDAVVQQPLAVEAVADADLLQQVDGALLEQAGADAGVQVFGGAPLQHDRFNAGETQQPGKQQPGGSATDNPDLRAHA